MACATLGTFFADNESIYNPDRHMSHSMGHKGDFYAVSSPLFLYPKKRFWFNQGNLPVTKFLNIGPCIHFLSKTKIRKDI